MRVSSGFNSRRNAGTRRIKRAFLLCFEGSRTEPEYFRALKESRKKVGIDELVEIVTLDRFIHQSGKSDPISVLNLVDDYVFFLKTRRYRFNLFLGCILDSLTRILGQDLLDKDAFKTIEDSLSDRIDGNGLINDDGVISDFDEACHIAEGILTDMFGEGICCGLEYCSSPSVEIRDTDSICIIVDRDSESNSWRKFAEFLHYCEEKGFEAYVTNPCFEFWLLLHYKDMKHLSEDEIAANKKEGGRRLLERELDGILDGYSKKKVDALKFIYRIDEAIDNQRLYCYELDCLPGKVGCNIGTLIQTMRNRT